MMNKRWQGVLRKKPSPVEKPSSSPALNKVEIRSQQLVSKPTNTVKASIYKKNLQANAHFIKQSIGESVKLCAVVKANGYGHDARCVVSSVAGIADFFAVSSLQEAQHIQPFVKDKPILITIPIYAQFHTEWLATIANLGIHATVCSLDAINYICEQTPYFAGTLKLHLKIETGMNRCGAYEQEALEILDIIRQHEKLSLTGVYTHFATADHDETGFAYQQFEAFQHFLTVSGLDQDPSVIKHACNSAGTFNLPEARMDMVRCGLSLYGISNTNACNQNQLKPVMKVQAPIIHTKTLYQGQTCGYDRSFVAPREMKIGIVPFGYSDGLMRMLSNRASMMIEDIPVGVLGNVGMDLTAIDLSSAEHIGEGDLITILDDRQESPCSITALAQLAHTIPYEIMTRVGERVKRVLIEE